jgi:predicted nucleic acid-binding protein
MDFLFKREGHQKAAEIFKLCSKGEINGFICAHEITTLYYFLSKSTKDKNKIKKSLSVIMKRFTIIETSIKILEKALSSEISDFEDAVIEASANDNNVDYILTKNVKDFKKSLVSVITPEEFLAGI